MKSFESINRAYNRVFIPGQLSIGLVVPIENYALGGAPDMGTQLERIQLAEKLDFKAVWLRDIPFNVPSFGDVGQMYDPFTYLGFLAGQTSEIALGISSIALPLRHPLHVAKSAATIDQLSGGRLIMGVASGDRYDEYPAMGVDYHNRGELFREAFTYIRKAQEDFPHIQSDHYGASAGQLDVLPKAIGPKIPMLMTGFSRQSLEWNAEFADGWMYYPRNIGQQAYTISQWRDVVADYHSHDKPFMQPLYVDLHADEDFKPLPIHLGFRIGAKHLIDYFQMLKEGGVNHIALNLRFNSGDMTKTLTQLAEKVLPIFNQKT